MKYLDTFDSGKYYHIMNHAVGNENLFRTAENYRYFLEKYQFYTSSVWNTYAYCLMPNHFHLLVRVHDTDTITAHTKYKGDEHKVVMQCLSNWLNSYAKAYNKMFERRGALFLDFTKRIEIDTETYFTTAINYIHQNPVNHGFCRSPSDWTHSSYHSFLSEKQTRLKRTEVLEWFGGKEQFQQFHQSNVLAINLDWEI